MAARDRFKSARHIAVPAIGKRPRAIVQHGETRDDAFAWLRDDNWRDVLRDPSRLDPAIRAALESENAYYAAVTDDLAPLRAKLLQEMRGKIKEHDAGPPFVHGPYRYWTEFREGGEYLILKRGRIGGGEPEVLFDGDAERGGAAFFSIGGLAHSPDHRLLAYAVDRVGSENYQIRVRRLADRFEHPEVVEHTSGGVVWDANSAGFFYVERDEHQRPKRIRYHRLGGEPSADPVIYEEPDDGFFLGVDKTLSGAFILIESSDHMTSEVRFIPADDPLAAPVLIAAREEGVEYSVDHRGDRFYILTNAGDAVDFKIVCAPVASPGRDRWTDVIPHAPGRLIRRMIVFARHIARLEWRNALPHIVVTAQDGGEHEIAFEEAAYDLSMSDGYEFDTDTLRYVYDSPATPAEYYDYDMTKRARTLVKLQEVPSGHDKSLYVVERFEASSHDGALVPVTILRRRDTPVDGTAAALLYGYGAYGITVHPEFLSNILPLVDRGMIYALAHVRGGEDLGRNWYLDGKLDRKQNSFLDFIAVAEALVDRAYAARGRIVSYGGSAGGLLIGAALNMRQDLFAAALGAVPFVDVLNTVSDETLPLTPPEWNEWGDPIRKPEQYRWIRAYSPYENVRETSYPPVMATAGLADYRVTYWEPAKWIAALRETAIGGPFVLRINMEAGHAGAAARFERLDERAHLYAFALRAVGMEDLEPRPSS